MPAPPNTNTASADPSDTGNVASDPESNRLGVSDTRIRAARDRLAWKTSIERRRLQVFAVFEIMAAPVLVGISLLISSLHLSTAPFFTSYERATFAALAVWAYISFPVFAARRKQLFRQFQDRRILGVAEKELEQAEHGVLSSGATDFLSLWTVTQKRLDYYHKIATTHAERSFLYGQIAAGLGFTIVLTSAFIAAFAHNTAASISTVVAGVSGGGLGAYIGATFMKSQDVASIQLRDYFRQPLQLSNYLAAERLLESLDEGERKVAVRGMIESIMKSSYSK
jgi:hypothetical protein